MKAFILLLLSAIVGHAQTTVSWQTRMIQNQLEGATGLPELVEDRGQRPSLPIGAKGSRFELWGFKIINGSLAVEKLLAATEVGVYLPTAEITISSADPYTGFKRSRVDQPFTVSCKISNLLAAGPNIPVGATKVLVEHYVDIYTLGSFDGSSIESTVLFRSIELAANGIHSYPFSVTNLSATDLIRRAGRERFVVYALADGDTPQRPIASAQIIILPVSSAALVGIEQGKAYKALPDFSAQIWRSYPGTSTWVEIYEGDYSSAKRGTMLTTTFETPGYIYSDDYTELSFSDFPTGIEPTVSGLKTIVIRASSPFVNESIAEGGRILDYKTIKVGNQISVNAMVTTIE